MSRQFTPEQLEAKRKYEREYRRRRYAEDPEYRKQKKLVDVRSRKAKTAKVASFKLERGCARCGYDKCARALEFHHTESDKEANIADLTSGSRSWTIILSEIAKCEVVCANCHAVEGCNHSCHRKEEDASNT